MLAASGDGDRTPRFGIRQRIFTKSPKERKESIDTTVASCDSDGNDVASTSREFALEKEMYVYSSEEHTEKPNEPNAIDGSLGPLSKATSALLNIRCDDYSLDNTKEESATALAAVKAIREENEAARALEESRERAINRWHKNQCASIVIEESDDEYESLYADASLRARREALLAQQQMLGEGHPDVLFMLENLGRVHYRRGNYQEAQRVFEESRRRSLFDVAHHGILHRHSGVPQL